MKKNRKKIKTMDVILFVIAVALTAFTVEMIVVFKETGMIPETLVTCVFASLGGECGAMAWIKTTKDRNREREWELEDRAKEKEDQEKSDEAGGAGE